MQNSKMPSFIALGLLVGALGLWAIDGWRSGRSDGQTAYVEKRAREITTIDVPNLENGELVIASDIPRASITDPDLGFSIEALSYRRDVEILQWREHEDTASGQTSYSYSKEWVDSPISSFGFSDQRYRNTGTLPFDDRTISPESISFGDLKLDKAFWSSLPSAQALSVTREMYDALPSYLRYRFAIVGGRLNPNRDPQIGDVRVSFSSVQPRQVTVVGAYGNGSIVPATTDVGTIAILRQGNLTLDELTVAEKSSNKTLGIVIKTLSGLMALGGGLLMFLNLRGKI